MLRRAACAAHVPAPLARWAVSACAVRAGRWLHNATHRRARPRAYELAADVDAPLLGGAEKAEAVLRHEHDAQGWVDAENGDWGSRNAGQLLLDRRKRTLIAGRWRRARDVQRVKGDDVDQPSSSDAGLHLHSQSPLTHQFIQAMLFRWTRQAAVGAQRHASRQVAAIGGILHEVLDIAVMRRALLVVVHREPR